MGEQEFKPHYEDPENIVVEMNVYYKGDKIGSRVTIFKHTIEESKDSIKRIMTHQINKSYLQLRKMIQDSKGL